MKIQCDVCEKAPATVICCADEAALCDECDIQVHAANKLASKHQRLLLQNMPTKLPMCDICQEKPAFIFCVEDRALFCRDCDEPIHVAGSLSGGHQRLLATGIHVALSSVCNKKDLAEAKNSTKPAKKNSMPSKSDVPKLPQTPSEFTASPWSVDEFLQLSDYEFGDKRGSPIGFGELDWFADIGLFPDQMPNETLAAAEVPELHYSPAANTTTYYRCAKSGMTLKRPRIEISDVEDVFTVPDLG